MWMPRVRARIAAGISVASWNTAVPRGRQVAHLFDNKVTPGCGTPPAQPRPNVNRPRRV